MPQSVSNIFDSLLPHGVTVILRNPQGTMELKGPDMNAKVHGDWITVHHGKPEDSERQSHLHLRRAGYGHAVIQEPENLTPQLTFWVTRDDVSDEKPPMALIFPTFYDWSDNKRPIPENRRFFEKWVAEHGRVFDFSTES